MSLLLLVIGVFLGGLGLGIAVGWWWRGEVWLGQRVTGKTMDFSRRKLGA